MKSLVVRFVLLFLIVAFRLGQFGGCSCIPSCIPIPKVVLIDDIHQNENNFDEYEFNAFMENL
ncbi:MAG: hypothetical protein ACP5K2_08430 [bacterium]